MDITNLSLFLFVPFTFTYDQALEITSPRFIAPIAPEQIIGPTIAANVIFKSSDNGETWQDISEGLPDQIDGDNFFANETELYISGLNGTYLGKPNSTAPYWDSENSVGLRARIAEVGTGLIAFNYEGQFLQKKFGADGWLPIYTNFKEEGVQTLFETTSGTVIIGCVHGIFKSADNGKTWKHVHNEGWAMQLAESNGVIIATGEKGILCSTDDGENWNWVLNEGGVGIDVAVIDGGFAAITYNTESRTRRVRASFDGGKTWQPIDKGLPAQESISSILQIGANFFCGHPDGIMRSSDQGKSWQLVLPSIENKVFNLFGSGNVIYAIPRNWGC